MKFLLVRPGLKDNNNFFIFTPSTHPPLGLLYIGSILEQNGHKVEVIDFYAEDISEQKLKNSLKSCDVVGMTVYTYDYYAAVEVSRMIKNIDPDIPLIIGGPHCTFLSKRSLSDIPLADISVIGEGEVVINDIVQNLNGYKKLHDINGIIFRENGSIVTNKPPKVTENLDSLPFPARHLVEKYDYGSFPFGYKLKKKTTSLMTTRGCPFKCRFCSRYSNFIKNWGFRQRSAENVVKEILEMNEKYHSLIIIDDNFLADKKRAHDIFDRLLKSDKEIDILIGGARVDTAEKKLYLKMKKTGVKFILYGLESGNQDVLDFYNKQITLQQIRNATKIARKMNFFIYASFIFGAPMETKEHIEKTIKFACSLPIDVAIFGLLGYMYGSSLWFEAVKNGKISEDEYLKIADKNQGLGNMTKEELLDFTMKAYKEFYFRPSYLASQIYRSVLRHDYSLLLNGIKFFPLIKTIGK